MSLIVKCGITRDGCKMGEQQGSPKVVHRTPGASCKALKSAVSCLYCLDDFTTECIGAGFFSKIYKVVHNVTGQVMVLKKNMMQTNRTNVLREIQLMNRLSHPNLLRFYGVCVIDGQLHALVEFINGGSLEQVLAEKTIDLSWQRRIRLACDIAKGIKFLHANGIMHRDLTSKNILIKKVSDSDNCLVAVVADLGLADRIPDPLSDRPVNIVGSPYWMAPECIMGKQYNEKADVFSYGIILCEIIARVEADPDILPRTKKYGLDYVAFSKMSADCPVHLLHLAFICCQIEPNKRPSFSKIVTYLEQMKYTLPAVILADRRILGIADTDKNISNRIILEKVLDEKLELKKKSEETTSNSDSKTSATSMRNHYVPVTPMIVGKVMSKDDANYAPQKGNPFPLRLRDAGAKFIGNIFEDCSEFLELHSPGHLLAPPATPSSPYIGRRLRRSNSLPGSPLFGLEPNFEFDHFGSGAKRTCSELTSIKKLAEDGDEKMELLDKRSEGSNSSFDSALGMDMNSKERNSIDIQCLRRRKASRPVGRSSSLMYPNNDAKKIAHYIEGLLQSSEQGHTITDDCFTRSYNSSGSHFSLAESSAVSLSNSFSSYDDNTDTESSRLSKRDDPKRKSKEQFQELRQNWEGKTVFDKLEATATSVQPDCDSRSTPARTMEFDLYLYQHFQEVLLTWKSKQETIAETTNDKLPDISPT